MTTAKCLWKHAARLKNYFCAITSRRFLPTFAAKLDREDPSGFYGKLAELCLRFVTAECARLQVACGAANLGLRPADDGRVPMACGSGAECTAMPGADVPDRSESV